MIERALREFPGLKIPVIDGGCQLVYEPVPEKPNTWFVNDHCLFQEANGRIHYFGIENPYPSTAQAIPWVSKELDAAERPFILTIYKMLHGHLYGKARGTHYRIGHAIADTIWGPWQRCSAALDGKADSKHYGSPFVVGYEGRFWMLLPSETGLAVSDDLMQWDIVKADTPWDALGKGHRDPCVLRLEDGTFLQYYASSDPNNRHVINVARSNNLLKWERLDPCFIGNIPEATWSGIYESPYVLVRDELFYLFVGFSHRRYYETFVVVSDNPYHFDSENTITTLLTHAPEFIEIEGQTYMSSCGIEDPQYLNHSGLWISKIQWMVQGL